MIGAMTIVVLVGFITVAFLAGKTLNDRAPACRGQISVATHINGKTHNGPVLYYPAGCAIYPKNVVKGDS